MVHMIWYGQYDLDQMMWTIWYDLDSTEWAIWYNHMIWSIWYGQYYYVLRFHLRCFQLVIATIRNNVWRIRCNQWRCLYCTKLDEFRFRIFKFRKTTPGLSVSYSGSFSRIQKSMSIWLQWIWSYVVRPCYRFTPIIYSTYTIVHTYIVQGYIIYYIYNI